MKKKLKEELKDKLDFNDEIQKDEKKPIVLKSKDKVNKFREAAIEILKNKLKNNPDYLAEFRQNIT